MGKGTNFYARGYNFERLVWKRMVAIGYFGIRSGGSRGPADLVFFKEGETPIFAQCKTGPELITPDERMKLATCSPYGQCFFVYKKGRAVYCREVGPGGLLHDDEHELKDWFAVPGDEE